MRPLVRESSEIGEEYRGVSGRGSQKAFSNQPSDFRFCHSGLDLGLPTLTGGRDTQQGWGTPR
jgi:hypothetical protein